MRALLVPLLCSFVPSVSPAAEPPPAALLSSPAPPTSGGLCRLDGARVIPRSELQAGLEAMAALPHQGLQLVPARQADGRYAFKVFGIRPGSIYDELGLRSGDVVLAVNGLEPRGTHETLAAYEALRGAAELHVTLSRRGEEVRLWLVFP